MSNEQSHLNGHHLANLSNYFDKLQEEGKAEEKANKGRIWTIIMDGTAHINALGLVKCDYTLHLNCSHVGPTMDGVYRGELGLEFNGDAKGTKLLLAAIGIGMSDDLQGWFKNDNFVMKIKPYTKEDVDGFIESFDESKNMGVEPTGDAAKDAATQAVAGAFQSFMSMFSATQNVDKNTDTSGDPVGLWYDWDFHMTEGDMGIFAKLNGGIPFIYNVSGTVETDSQYHSMKVDDTVKVIFNPTFKERYTEQIDSPFPYTVVMYPDGTVKFTLYNCKGGPVTVNWVGKVTSIPVEETTVIK